jgi:hypothetical protein
MAIGVEAIAQKGAPFIEAKIKENSIPEITKVRGYSPGIEAIARVPKEPETIPPRMKLPGKTYAYVLQIVDLS